AGRAATVSLNRRWRVRLTRTDHRSSHSSGAMSLHRYPTRFLVVTAATSFLLLSSTVAIGVYLNGERARTDEELGQNIGSRRAATRLVETLTDLLALRAQGVQEVTPLHDRVASHLEDIR